MGTNNRQRRAAKKRRASGGGGGRVTPPLRVVRDGERGFADGHVREEHHDHRRQLREVPIGDLLDAVFGAHLHGLARDAATLMDELIGRESDDPANDLAGAVFASGPRVSRPAKPSVALSGRLVEAVSAAWRDGWQPADLMRHVHRELTAADEQLMGMLIAEDALRYLDTMPVHPLWAAQLEAIGPRADWDPRRETAFERWATKVRAGVPERIYAGVTLMTLLLRLPRLQVLIPWPGADPGVVDPSLRHIRMEAATAEGIDRKLLVRVRALLAKAESTTFPEEADSLTVKAQELMTRHSIDSAMLHGHETEHVPSARRIPIDDPYAGPKADLLHQIGLANRCSTVSLKQLGFATVLGFDFDLDVVELLYTSLLVQATTAMVSAGSQADLSGRSTTRSFRQSFLLSFAVRIGQRLQQAADATTLVASSEIGSALVPVLAERDEAVTAARDAVFPNLTRRTTRASHAGGWAAGKQAADLADLGARDPSQPAVRR